jgi:hypothetical protein
MIDEHAGELREEIRSHVQQALHHLSRAQELRKLELALQYVKED